MSILLTREELYEMVWEQPVTKVAAELEISDVAVAKICRKYKIPVPGRGYWAKVAVGKPVKTISLPKLANPNLDQIQILGGGQRYSPSIRAARDRSKVLAAQQTGGKGAGEPTQSEPSLHIEKLKKKLSTAKARRDGFIRISGKRQFTLAITPASIERAISSLEKIVNEAMSRGYEIKPSKDGLSFLIGTEMVAFSLTEALTRLPHQPTEAEQAKLKRWKPGGQERHELPGFLCDKSSGFTRCLCLIQSFSYRRSRSRTSRTTTDSGVLLSYRCVAV